MLLYFHSVEKELLTKSVHIFFREKLSKKTYGK